MSVCFRAGGRQIDRREAAAAWKEKFGRAKAFELFPRAA